MKRMLVTGCLGFIGSHFCRYMLNKYKDISIVGFDRYGNQKNLERIKDFSHNERFNILYGDLTISNDISGIVEDIDYIIHFAAFTFVDHSIKDPTPFIQSNIVGTFNLLEQARKYKPQKYVQISTDEVYGAIIEGAYSENDRLNPTNIYSASKAAADMLALAYFNTYKLPIMITRTENNYGPYQHPQKAIPVFIKKALNGEPLPVYGDGKHRRMWLYVADHCRAIDFLLDYGELGQIYHVAGEQELENLELAKIILKTLGKSEDMIKFIDDHDIRPGHDRRYALDISKFKSLGWQPVYNLTEGLKETINWYKQNDWWLK